MSESMLGHIRQFAIWILAQKMPYTPLRIIETPLLNLLDGGMGLKISHYLSNCI